MYIQSILKIIIIIITIIIIIIIIIIINHEGVHKHPLRLNVNVL